MRSQTAFLLGFALAAAMVSASVFAGILGATDGVPPVVTTSGMAQPPPPDTAAPPYRAGLESTVMVEFANKSHCTGVLHGSNRILLTATHCIERTSVAYITSHTGRRVAVEGKVIANDGSDHVLVRLDRAVEGRPAQIAPMPPPGTEIYLWGHPGDLEWQLRVGYVQGRMRSTFVDGRICDVVGLDIWHGDSGGAIFDARGRVVGLAYGYTADHNPFSRVTWRAVLSQPFRFSAEHLSQR